MVAITIPPTNHWIRVDAKSPGSLFEERAADEDATISRLSASDHEQSSPPQVRVVSISRFVNTSRPYNITSFVFASIALGSNPRGSPVMGQNTNVVDDVPARRGEKIQKPTRTQVTNVAKTS